MSENEDSNPGLPESGSNLCPTCGEVIPVDAPGGICPRCALLEAALPPDPGTIPMNGPRFAPPSLETIAKAFPQLEIIELIGCGGMGAVYEARQPNLDRRVALKVLPLALAESPAFTERFTREGRLLAKLNHPNIVGVHDFGESGGFFYLLMEFVDGVNLRQAMRAGRFTPEQAFGIVPEICVALQFAHDEGILHRDIKPENILLDAKGRVKIADFGIAKLIGESAAAEFALTGTSVPGTPQYMAPEQIEHPEDVDHRADIFSLGVVFYEMLTGELPLGRFSAPSEKSTVDSQIDEIVFRSLEKERSRRQQSAGQVKTEIENSVESLARMRHPGYGIPAEKPSPTGITSGGGKAALLVATGLVLLLAFVALPIFVWQLTASQANEFAAQREIEKAESQRSLAILADEIAQIERRLSSDPGSPSRGSDLRELLLKKDQFSADTISLREKNATIVTRRASIFFVAGPVVIISLLILCVGIPGTMMGWKSLHRIRALGLTESPAPAMFAALFWPFVLLSIILLALIALPMSFAPRWIAGLGLSLTVVAIGVLGWLIIKRARRWMSLPPTESEKARALAWASKPKSQWVSRILWTLLILTFVPILILLFFRFGGPVGMSELLVIAGIILFFILIIWFLTHPRRIAAPASHNPWPRRIFWLGVVIFVAPTVIVLTGLVSYFAIERPPEKSHSVEFQNIVEGGNSVTASVVIRRYGKGNVKFRVVQEAPDASPTTGLSIPASAGRDLELVVAGAPTEWILYRGHKVQTHRIAFAFPDHATAAKASRMFQENARKHPDNFRDTGKIELFDVEDSEGGTWRAWIEIESESIPNLEAPLN